MEQSKFLKYISWLGYRMPEEMQKEAIKQLLAEDITMYIPTIINDCNGSSWDNILYILKVIGYPDNKPVVPKLFEMMGDMNWSFAPAASDLIESIYYSDNEIIMTSMENATRQAIKEKDSTWLWGIYSVVKRLGIGINDFYDKDLYVALEQQIIDDGGWE